VLTSLERTCGLFQPCWFLETGRGWLFGGTLAGYS
jgi:hypothetical protein